MGKQKNKSLVGGGWNSQQTIQGYQQVLSNMPGHTESVLADQKRRIEEAKRKKEEQARLIAEEALAYEQAQLTKEGKIKEENQKALEQQEAAFKAEDEAKELAPKNFVEKAVQQALGPETPKFFDYKKEKKEFEKLNEMTYAGKRNKFFEESQKQLLNISNKDSWLEKTGKTAANLFTSFGNVVTSFAGAGVAEAFERGFTPEEEKRHKQLEEKINKIEIPIKKQQQAEIKKERDAWKTKAETRKQALEKQLIAMQSEARMKTDADYEAEQAIQDELLQMQHIEENYEDAINRYEDGINTNGYDFWKGLARDTKSTLSVGLFDMDNASMQAGIVDKLKRKEKGEDVELTETERDLLSSAIVRSGAESAGITGEYYDLGDGVRQSAMFMAEMALVSRFTGGISSAASKMLQGSSAFVKGGVGLLGEVAATAAMPSTSIKALDSYSKSLQQITDEDGNKSFIVSDAAKLGKAKEIKRKNIFNKKLISDTEEKATKYFEENGETNPELEKELEKLYNTEKTLQSMTSELVDEEGEIINKERNWVDAVLTGFTSNLTERLAERYVGAAADKGFGAVGNFASNSKLGQAIGKSKVGSAANWVDRQLVKGRRVVDDKFFDGTKAGGLTKAFYNHVGPAKMIHSLPAEMIEEVAVQLTPQYMEDYNKQLDELTDPGFYKQVALSTLAIGGGTSVMGLAKHAGMYATNAEYKDDYKKDLENRKRLKNLYRSLDEAVTDDQVANDIAMSTLGTMYSIGDYQARIAQLRNKDAEDKEGKTQEERDKLADDLEQKSFYNMAYQALSTGTERDFKSALTSLSKNENLGEETKASAKLALIKLENLKERHDAHRNKINFADIMEASLREDILRQTIQDQEFELEEMRVEDKWAEDLEKIREKNNFEKEYPLDQLALEDLQDDDINNYVAVLQAESPELKAFLDKSLILNSLKKDLAETKTKLDYETDPNNAKEIKKRHQDKAVEAIIAKTDSSNVGAHLEMLKQSGLATPENIAKINQRAIDNVSPTTVENDLKREEQLYKEIEVITDEMEKMPNAKKAAQMQKQIDTYKVELEEIKTRREKASEGKTAEETQEGGKVLTEAELLAEEQARIQDVDKQLESIEENIAELEMRASEGEVSMEEVNALLSEKEELEKEFDQLATSIKQRKADIKKTNDEAEKTKEKKEEEIKQAAEAKELRKQQEEQEKINKGIDDNREEIDEALSEAELALLLTQPRTSLTDIFDTSSSADEAAADEAMDEGLFAPLDFDQESDSQRDYVDKMKNVITKMRKAGLNPNFSGFITGLRSRLNNDPGIENLFNLLAIAYQEAYDTSLSEAELINVYESHFGNDILNEFSDLINNPGNVTASTIQVAPAVAPDVVVENTAVQTSIENKVLDTETTLPKNAKYTKHTERLYKETGLKLGGVLGREYEETEEGKVTVSTKINKTAIPFLDWRNFRPGSEVEFKFHIDYLLDPKNILSTWTNTEAQNLNGKDKPIKIKSTVKDTLLDIFSEDPDLNTWEKITSALQEYKNNPSPDNPLFGNEEFLKIVPIGTVNNGLTDEFDETGTPISSSELLLGGLSDNNWFNTSNVALRVDDRGEPMLSERENRIEENKRINMEARQEILANGSFKTTVANKADKKDNTRSLEDATNNFYSILDAFGSIEEFEKHATIAIFNDNNFLSSKTATKKGIIATIDGVPITKDKIVNFEAYMANAVKQGYLHKPIFIHKSGINENGEYQYTMRDVITKHDTKAEEFARQSAIAGRLQFIMKDKANKDLAKKIAVAFKNKFGFDINTPDLVNKFRGLYPDNLRSGEGVRQDYKLEAMGTRYEMIPDFRGFKSGDEFIEALLSDNTDFPTINKKEFVLGNFHTNLIFTPITKNGETIYTEHSQPFAMFSYKGSGARVSKTQAEISQNHKKNLENVLVTAKKDLANAKTTQEIEIIENKIKKIEKKLEEAATNQKAQNSVITVPGKVAENNDFFQDLSENLGLSNKEDAVKMFNESIENFVNSHFDMLVDNLDAKGIIKKECK